MKKFFLIILFFISFDVKALGSIYISKRDINTNDYVYDCDFLLYDELGNVVDSWVQDNSIHVSNVPVGTYRLVERPIVINSFSDEMNRIYQLNIDDDDILELVLYNKKIETPRNLGYNNYFLYGTTIIILGFIIIFFSRKFNYI